MSEIENKEHAEFFIKLKALLHEYNMQIDSDSLDCGVRVHSRALGGSRKEYTNHSLYAEMQQIAERRLVDI